MRLRSPLFLAIGLSAMATDASEAAPAGALTNPHLGTLISHLGPTAWICLFLAALVAALVVEGFLKFRYAALIPSAHYFRLHELLAAGEYGEARDFCRTHRSFLCAMAGAGLERIERGKPGVKVFLEETAGRQEALMRAPIEALSAIGVLAPMIGLTGTVLGMGGAFLTLSRTGTGDFASLASAIGQVLYSTAGGLLVAVPAFFFHYYFKGRSQQALLRANATLFHLFDPLPLSHIRPAERGARMRRWEEEAEFGLQIAPLLDLLFVLLLFFMIVAGGPRTERELPLAADRAGSANGAAAPSIRIDIDASGQVFWNHLPVGTPRDAMLAELRERLRQLPDETTLVIAPQARSRQERIIAVLDACKASGGPPRRIAFAPPDAGGS